MEWLTNSEAVVWQRVYAKHKNSVVSHKQIVRLTPNEKALNKKLSNITRKQWLVGVSRGRYFVPAFEHILEKQHPKAFKVDTIGDAESVWDIPLAVGAPVANEMYWYPTRRPLHIYVLQKHQQLVESKHKVRVMSEEVWGKTVEVDALHVLSLEDTIIESLQDNDLQSAMALAHRQKNLLDWSYLIKRVHEEKLEDLAYTSLDRFPRAARKLRKYRDPRLPKMTDSFIKKVLWENTVPAMRRRV